MKRIASFEVDHTKLLPGVYTSRVDGDITTYDIRMRRPNAEEVIDNASLHTIEHLFATFVRNSAYSDKVIYFGPMGCRTGCYFLVRNMEPSEVIDLIRDTFAFIASFDGDIPGVSAAECGNFREHSLAGAKQEAVRFAEVIRDWTTDRLTYES